MKRFQPLLTALLSMALVAGCAPVKVRPVDADLPYREDVARAALEAEWQEPAVVREGTPMMVLVTPTMPPDEILRRQIKLELESGATVHDIVAVLANLGYSVIITDKEAAEAPILAPRYHGTLGGLLSSIQRAADVWVTWENGALVVSRRERIVFSLPQERKLAERVASGLNDLGLCVTAGNSGRGIADSVTLSDSFDDTGLGSSSRGSSSSGGDSRASSCSRGGGSSGGDDAQRMSAAAWEAGMITLFATPDEYRRALTFLERITQNAAIVNLQVAMVSVSMNQDAKRGIDWTKLQLAIGGEHAQLIETLKPQETAGGSSGGTGDTGGVTTPINGGIGTSRENELPFTGKGVLLHAGALRGVISNGAFSMVGFLDFLETYGRTRTLQSVMLRTVTGSEVELKSVTKIPYVSGVGIGTLGTTNSVSGTLGSANTDTANDGITLRMLPSYDAASHSVTIDMALTIEAVLAFNELRAGNQLGTLTQPTTAERAFNDVIRVRPGQTVVVGGIAYDQLQRDNNVPLYLPDSAGHASLKVKRESMFIVIRPTVTVLGALKVKEGALAGTLLDKTETDTPSESARDTTE